MSAIVKNISLYIPHVFPNITRETIEKAFQYIGSIKDIDFILKMNQEGKQYYAVYIHFSFWYQSEVAYDFQNQILNRAEGAKLYYENRWYWIVLENKAQKYVSGERKPRINLDGSNAISISSNTLTPYSKNQINNKCPNAPIKKTETSSSHIENMFPFNLETAFDAVAEQKPIFNSFKKIYMTIDQAIKRVDYLETIEVPDPLDQPTKLELLQYQDVYNEMNELREQIDQVQMEELEREMETEDNHFIRIDGRYVRILEDENRRLREEMESLKQRLNGNVQNV